MSVTVSAKIPRELRDKLRELNVNVSRVIRESLEREVRRREEERLRRLASEVSVVLRKIPDGEIVRLVREMREER